MIIFMQDTVLIIQHYIKELKDFASFFIMHILTAESVLNHYELISLPCITAQHVNSLATVTQILKQNTTTTEDSFKSIKYDIAIVYFKRLIKHLNTENTTSTMKMKLLNNCFDEWHKVIKNVIEEAEDLS